MRSELTASGERRAARRTFALGCGLAAAFLSPLVDHLLLGGVVGVPLLWASASAFALTALVTRNARSPEEVVGRATVAGIAYLPVLFVPLLLARAGLIDRAPGMEFDHPVAAIACGSIVSAPMGTLFGAIFAPGFRYLEPNLRAPCVTLRAEASTAAAITLGLAALATIVFVAPLQWPYDVTIFAAPPIAGLLEELAQPVWLSRARFFVVPLPLVTLSLGFAVHAHMLARRRARLLDALVRDAHPALVIAVERVIEGDELASSIARGTLPLWRPREDTWRAHAVVDRPLGESYRDTPPIRALAPIERPR